MHLRLNLPGRLGLAPGAWAAALAGGATVMLLAWAFPTLLVAGPGLEEEYVTTPGGERVKLESVNHSAMPSGSMVETYSQYTDAQGNRVLHGVYIKAYKNGVQKERTTYAHGVKDGPFAKRYDNGNLEVAGSYADGKLNGEVRWYFESGAVREVQAYVAGQLEGPFVTYFESGAKKEEGVIRAGSLEGPYTEFYDNGQVAATGTYHEGFLTGPYTLYDREGRKLAEGKLDHDRIAGDWHCFAAPGGRPSLRRDCDQKVYLECRCD